MKLTKAAVSSIDVSSLSIPDAEEIIEEALGELTFSSDPGLARALHFLAPAGYQAIVELCSENGRSKRRNASADVWSPEEDEIRIYFERIDEDGDAEAEAEPGNVKIRTVPQPKPRALARPQPTPVEDGNFDESLPGGLPPDVDDRIKELCATLAEAERGGHAFIALKWFRDSFLPRKTYRWNQNPDSRQAILAEAIQRGVVLTSKIPNPKTPAYPTTTIRLNRAEAGVPEEAQRFRPVAVHGESLADNLDDDRGNL